MNPEADYANLNRRVWNDKTDYHILSDFYDMAGFRQGKTSLKEIELALLGDVKGKRILHLQCHFGQDSLSLARMGASVVGLDLSDKAVEKATELAAELGLDARFICCNVYDLPEHLGEEFDLVFTTYGTVGWLPDIAGWAALVARYLKPGGQFVFADFHPVVWMFDDQFREVAYRYFQSEAIVETGTGTYADRDAPIQAQSVSWNHAMSEVVSALIANGLRLDSLLEYDYSPYNCFRNMVEEEPGRYRIAHMGNKLPMVYSIVAIRNRNEVSED